MKKLRPVQGPTHFKLTSLMQKFDKIRLQLRHRLAEHRREDAHDGALTGWHEEHGRHEIFAGGKKVALGSTSHSLKLDAEAGTAGEHGLTDRPRREEDRQDGARREAGRARRPTFKTTFHLASTRARHVLERHACSEGNVADPSRTCDAQLGPIHVARSVTWFAKGLGSARERRLEDARAAASRLDALEAGASSAGEDLFARNIRILRLAVRAWVARSEQDANSSVALMRQAADLDPATPKHAVTPAPTLPAHELLGDLFTEHARPTDALVMYRRSLELYPRRFNSLLGAARAAPALEEARAFVTRRP